MLNYLLKIINTQNKEIYVLKDCLQSTRQLLEEEREKNEKLLAILLELRIQKNEAIGLPL